MLNLDGKVAVVTGAGAGLGRAEALALARAGAHLVVNDVADTGVVDEIEALGGKAVLVRGDVSSSDTARAITETAVERFGGLHILVNNAGVLRDRMLFNMSDDEWDLVLRVHLRGHFLLSRNAAAYWRGQAKANGRGQGRHRLVDGRDRPWSRALRREGQRDLSPRAYRDDRGRVRGRT